MKKPSREWRERDSLRDAAAKNPVKVDRDGDGVDDRSEGVIDRDGDGIDDRQGA